MKTGKAARVGALLGALAVGVSLLVWALATWYPAPIDKATDLATDLFKPSTYRFQSAWMTEEARVVYPAEARRKNYEGSTVLAMKIASNGHVESVRVEQTSGHEILDAAAVKAAKHFKIDPSRLGADAFPFEKLLKLTFHLEAAAL